jgi:hypothetical protein
MTIDDLTDILVHWRKCPPAHLAIKRIDIMMAAYLGVDASGAEAKPERKECTAAEMRRIAAKYGVRNG